MSLSLISISISLDSNNGDTETDAKEVCLREFESNGDILTRR